MQIPSQCPGRFYVDDTCVDCGLCPESLPTVFRRDDHDGQSYVWQQPSTAEEIAEAVAVAAICPTESIGTDG